MSDMISTNTEPITILEDREFLTHLKDPILSWEDSFISVRVQSPHRYYEHQPFDLAAQFRLSDGSHTVEFYTSPTTTEQVNLFIEQIKKIQNKLEVFCEKLKVEGDKLDALNKDVKTD